MAGSMKTMSLLTATLGVISFVLGVVAENKKPPGGTPVTGKDVVICKYPRDPTVVLGILSVIFLFASSAVGYVSLFKDYKGKSVPRAALFQSTSFSVFFNIALGCTGLAAALLIWPTVTEHMHLTKNVHHNLETDCPTAKTGLLGGGAFVSLDSMLFWLVALMLADNARKDFLDDGSKEVDGDDEEFNATAAVKGTV
ncbi:OLC1v1013682C1 [Oldenlandia corymbosa var. corymbosa]|uniref:OLC1v1013682C1 n=1 Tax=Oldenlandia corymbosa var. corymbosa TaxID=529605 RepID=A0AAV1DYT7_OLDCO|nr:OLC1v1013682C1 [Oldenlandia corymbosa var. corymbosa]